MHPQQQQHASHHATPVSGSDQTMKYASMMENCLQQSSEVDSSTNEAQEASSGMCALPPVQLLPSLHKFSCAEPMQLKPGFICQQTNAEHMPGYSRLNEVMPISSAVHLCILTYLLLPLTQ